jgi:hypothetical protein
MRRGNAAKRSRINKQQYKHWKKYQTKRLAEILHFEMFGIKPIDEADERFRLALAKSDPAI